MKYQVSEVLSQWRLAGASCSMCSLCRPEICAGVQADLLEAEFVDAREVTEIAKANLAEPAACGDENCGADFDDFEEARASLRKSGNDALINSGPLAIKWLEVSA